MNYDQREKAEDLKAFLNINKTKNTILFRDEQVLEEDLKWNASLFLAKAIHLALPFDYEFTVEVFDIFKARYEIQTGAEFNTRPLFEKFWLRNIMGYIEMSGSVSRAVHTFDDISAYRNELQFLLDLTENTLEEQRAISENDLIIAMDSFQRRTNIKLILDGVYLKRWLSKEKDSDLIKISNINVYFKPYLDHWSDFQFLSALKKERRKDVQGLCIHQNELEQLHNSFGQFYTKIPSIQTFIDQSLFVFSDGFYHLNFWNSKTKYWSNLCDKITGNYWEILLDDHSIINDEMRIKKFLEQTFYWDNHPNALRQSPRQSKKRFLDAAFNLVQGESDYSGADQEFKKVNIDRPFASEAYVLFHNRDEYEDFTLNNSDHFELLESLNLWERKASTTYLHEQSSRAKVEHLIRLIVLHDDEYETAEPDNLGNLQTYNFRRVFALLNASLDRPSILWQTTRYIILSRREIVPYLLTDKKFVSLAFQLIDEFECPFNERGESSTRLWKKCIDFALLTIRLNFNQAGTAPILVFQIFRALNSKKYRISNGTRTSKVEKENRKKRISKEDAVLLAIESSPLNNHKIHGGQDEYLLPNIAEDLANHFMEFREPDLYNNGTVQFPLMQWDGLTWLMKCSTLWKYHNQLPKRDQFVHQLAHSFFNLYVSIMEMKEVSKYNYFDKRQEKGLPLWSEKIERLDLIDWVYPIYFINAHQLLNSFLEPRFVFDPNTELYHKANQFTADKLRTHLGVLIQVLRKLVLPTVPYGLEKATLLTIKSRIENQIVDYLKKHIRDVPEEGRIDLFEFYKEWGFEGSDKEALLPQIARAINWFDNKKDIIDAIVQSQDLIKLLTIAEGNTSEGVRKLLFEKIQQSDIPTFLSSIRGIATEKFLFQIRQYPELLKQIEQIVVIWKSEPSRRKSEHEFQLFATELLLAYFRGDENLIFETKEPKTHRIHGKELSAIDLKYFYTGLLWIKRKAKQAHEIFENLNNKYTHFPSLALNRMVAKINMAHEDNDNPNLYREALEEWNDYSTKIPFDTDSFEDTLYTNTIYVLNKLKDYVALDETFRKLELPFQMLPDILSIKIESLIDQRKIEEALSLLEEAENYHQFSGLAGVQFINDLKSSVNGIDNVAELRIHYSRIFDSAPSKLIRIFPERINGRIDLWEFIAKEVALASSRMLDKINSLPDILELKNTSKENRINDLLELALEARFSCWGWSIKSQNRKAFSPGAKDLGEIDLDIRNSNLESFVTCEAFILRDRKRVQLHLKKLIANYTHQRKSFLVMTYYAGEHKDFDSEWTNYLQNTLPSVQYPSGYELEPRKVADITNEFGYENSGIRIGKGTLKSGSLLFNIFINTKYAVK